MAKSPNQKLKLLYLMRLFLERTDEAHPVTVPELIAALGQYGISAERKSLYDDFEGLRHFGLEERLHGERGGMLEMRKHIAWYISGMRGAARFREQINGMDSPEAVKAALMEFAESAERE